MTVENFLNCRIAYIRRIGKYGIENKETMEKIKEWAKKRQLYNKDAIIYSIMHDNPEITSPEKCRYGACIIIKKDFDIDDSVEECDFIGGKFIVFKIIHTTEEIQKAYMEIFPKIIIEGYKIANRPIIERYSFKMVKDGFCEICVPIE
jgi:DNA gyrase inhibitor GyrI